MKKFYLPNSILLLAKTWKLMLSLFFIPFIIYSQAPTTQTYDASGTWTIAAGSGYHANILVEVWGSGGGGAGFQAASGSGGGGGGAYSSTTYPNAGAGTYTITIGNRGTAGEGNTAGGTGGPSSFTKTGITQTRAVGGSGGGATGGIGAGGLASTGTGTIKKDGGNGGTQNTPTGGGGGGGGTANASSNAVVGGNAVGNAGGVGGGGIGGNGSDINGTVDAQAGKATGGGGGGRGTGGGNSQRGGAGRVTVTVISFLAIQYSSFYITPDENPVLHWSTLSELNNSHFTIEHSRDGIQFKEIATVSGHGITDKKTDYSYTHLNANPGINYYKLNQIDIDHTISLALIQSTMVKAVDITVYPAIAIDRINLNLPNDESDTRWTIFNTSGLKYSEGVIRSGTVSDQLFLNGVPSGPFILTVASKNSMKSFKLVKM
ncbi:MAG: hypothetical protein ABI761_09285 [Saprospiraceae bacterium]